MKCEFDLDCDFELFADFSDDEFHSVDSSSHEEMRSMRSVNSSSTAAVKSDTRLKYKKSKNKLKRVLPAPRILKRDIRNLYSIMLGHVINRGNCDLIHSFYETFCHRDAFFTFETSKTCSVVTDDYSRCSKFYGAQNAGYFFNTNVIVFPDLTYTLSESKLHRSSGTDNSFITIKFTNHATSVYDTSQWTSMRYNNTKTCQGSEEAALKRRKVISRKQIMCQKYINSDSSTGSSSDSSLSAESSLGITSEEGQEDSQEEEEEQLLAQAADEDDEDDTLLFEAEAFSGRRGYVRSYSPIQVHKLISTSPLQAKPWALTTVGTITMHMDEDKRITRMDYFTEQVIVNGRVK